MELLPPIERVPSFGELRAFVIVVEELHFARAAQRLGIAPSSLSQTIRRLEASLGTVLMERTPRSVRLTDAGLELLPRARDLLTRMEETWSALHPVTSKEPFTVGISSNGFAEMTAPIMQAFRRTQPDTKLVLRDVTENPTAVITGEVDVALVRPPIMEQDDSRVMVTDIVDEPRVAFLPDDHRLAGEEAISISDLADERFVEVGPGAGAITDYWAATDSLDGLRPRMGAGASSVAGVLYGVAYLGNVITSIPSVLRFYNVPGISTVPLTDVPPATMGICTRVDDDRPITAAFCETVRRVSAGTLELVPGARLVPASPDA